MESRYESFTVLINRIARNIRRIKTEEMAEFNLKVPHVSCLYYLYQFDGLTPGKLCELCDEDKAAISRSLDYLEKEGYILRDKSGSYRNKIMLTIQGCEVAQQISEKIDRVIYEATQGVNEQQRTQMYEALGTISSNLESIVKNK